MYREGVAHCVSALTGRTCAQPHIERRPHANHPCQRLWGLIESDAAEYVSEILPFESLLYGSLLKPEAWADRGNICSSLEIPGSPLE